MASAPKSPTSPTSPTSPVPTFLSTDPYPSHRDGRPTSSASAATDTTSEFGTDDFKSAKERQSNLTTMTGMTGPVGDVGLPPSRPTTAGTAQTSKVGKRESLQLPPSQKGPFGKDGGSRPSSSVSKTHVPTLTAPGFFRPMSSSKLQAQRNATAAQAAAGASQDQTGEARSTRSRRYSDASLNTLRDAKAASIKGGKSKQNEEEMPPMPVSRGTQFTNEPEGTVTTNASVNSATPLQTQRNTPNRLEVNGLRSSNTPSEKTPRSPRSLRASLGIGSRNSRQEIDRRPSPKHHEKLDSNPGSPHYAEKSTLPTAQPQPQPSVGKNHEYFAGNLLFFLSGRCLNTRAKPLNVLTFVLTTLPAALFFAFSAPWLWHNVSPAIPIIFAYVFLITLSSFLQAAFSDPGILPRNMHPHPPNPEEERDPLTVGPATTEWVMVKTFPGAKAVPQRANTSAEAAAEAQRGGAQAMEVPTKYCKTCSIWRPPRAHHCRVCDACIETQDHHCVWINNCVGRRNYRFFFSYVALASLLALLLLAFTLTHVGLYAQHNGISFNASLTGRVQERVAFAMFIYSLLALPYPGSLFGYHLFLIARGETTREYLNSHKFLKKDRHRPFAQAVLLRNWLSVLTRPRPPTYLQFKRSYTPGDVRFGHTTPKKERKRDLKNRYSTTGPPSGPAGSATGFAGGAALSNGHGNGNGAVGNGQEVEMKSLPPNTGSTQTTQTTQPAKPQVYSPTTGDGSGPGRGVVDRTPR